MVRAGSGRLLPLWGLLAGAVAGAVWGGLAGLWMRLITVDAPTFTWSETLFVVGLFAVTGMLAGLVHGARRRAWRGRPMVALRLLGILPLALLALGPGALLAPVLVLAVLCLVVWGGTAAALTQSFAAVPGAGLPRTALGLVVSLLLLVGAVVLVRRRRSAPPPESAAAARAAPDNRRLMPRTGRARGTQRVQQRTAERLPRGRQHGVATLPRTRQGPCPSTEGNTT